MLSTDPSSLTVSLNPVATDDMVTDSGFFARRRCIQTVESIAKPVIATISAGVIGSVLGATNGFFTGSFLSGFKFVENFHLNPTKLAINGAFGTGPSFLVATPIVLRLCQHSRSNSVSMQLRVVLALILVCGLFTLGGAIGPLIAAFFLNPNAHLDNHILEDIQAGAMIGTFLPLAIACSFIVCCVAGVGSSNSFDRCCFAPSDAEPANSGQSPVSEEVDRSNDAVHPSRASVAFGRL